MRLLTVNSSRVGRLELPRTETVDDNVELALLGAHLVQGAQRWLACCYQRRDAAPPRATSFDQTSLPREDDLAEELREPTAEEMRQAPEAVVLRPVKLVLKWFEKIATRSQL